MSRYLAKFRCRIGWHRHNKLERIHKMSDMAWVVCEGCGTPEPPPRTIVTVDSMKAWNRDDFGGESRRTA